MQSILRAVASILVLLTIQAQAPPTKHSFAITTGDGPVITDQDIIDYGFAQHSIRIRGESLARLARIRPSVSGTPFEVLADGERIYSGKFISPLSSMSYKEPTILVNVDTNFPTANILIRAAYFHEPQFQTGTDPRIDARITRALAALNKLSSGIGEGPTTDAALTRRVSEILLECAKLKPGTTRGEFMKVFAQEGGLSNAKHRRFAHRSCPYIKVDVEFNLTDPNQKILEERPTDKVSTISKPFLEWSIID